MLASEKDPLVQFADSCAKAQVVELPPTVIPKEGAWDTPGFKSDTPNASHKDSDTGQLKPNRVFPEGFIEKWGEPPDFISDSTWVYLNTKYNIRKSPYKIVQGGQSIVFIPEGRAKDQRVISVVREDLSSPDIERVKKGREIHQKVLEYAREQGRETLFPGLEIDSHVPDDVKPVTEMEKAQDGTLFDHLSRGGDSPITFDSRKEPLLVLDILSQMNAALGIVHAAGYLHSDIKPGNFLVTKEGNNVRVMLSDFGISKSTTQAQVSHSANPGTLEYMDPKHFLPSISRDMFALRQSFREVVSGHLPFNRGLGELTILDGSPLSTIQMLNRVLINKGDLSTADPSIPKPLVELVDNPYNFLNSQTLARAIELARSQLTAE